MSFTTATDNASGILPPEFAQLVVKPLTEQGLAFDGQVATVQNISSNELRIPVVVRDPAVGWVAEGEEIGTDVPELDELTVSPSKIAGITVITRELANDSNPAAQQLVGEGLAREISHSVDRAFFGDLSTDNPNAPAGLESLTGVHMLDGGTLTNLDVFSEAVSAVEGAGGTVTAFVTDPATALRIATLKTADGHNSPLLPNPREVLQRPVLVSHAVSRGTAWALDSNLVHTVLREDVELAVSEQAYFSSDRIALRATLRAGFGFPSEEHIARISVDLDGDGDNGDEDSEA